MFRSVHILLSNVSVEHDDRSPDKYWGLAAVWPSSPKMQCYSDSGSNKAGNLSMFF